MKAEMSRRMFLAGSASLASGCLATRMVGPDEDWKTVFRMMGFDPEAKGCGTFAVIGDPHVTDSNNEPLSAMIRFWNAMSPRPAFALSVGDQLCRISMCFGDRQWPADPKWKAACDREIEDFKALIAPCEIPFKHVIGNHDTYPDEIDAKFYASHFPGWKPYERFDALGVQFMLLNAGHDAWIDPKQDAWMAAEAAKLDDGRACVLVAHQPQMLRHRENGIPRAIRKNLANRRGEFWFLGGHEHHNRLERYHLPNGTMLGVATHTRAPYGFWLYGVRNGSIVARLFIAADGLIEREFGKVLGTFRGWKAPRAELLPSDMEDKGLVPLPFENTKGILWKTHVGEDDDKRKYLVECWDQSDAGHWYFYIGRTTYRLPLKEAKGATHAAFLGRLAHHRKTGEVEKVWLSTDNANWTLCPDALPTEDVYAYEIPESMRSADWIYLRVDGFRLGNDSCIAGYALMGR